MNPQGDFLVNSAVTVYNGNQAPISTYGSGPYGTAAYALAGGSLAYEAPNTTGGRIIFGVGGNSYGANVYEGVAVISANSVPGVIVYGTYSPTGYTVPANTNSLVVYGEDVIGAGYLSTNGIVTGTTATGITVSSNPSANIGNIGFDGLGGFGGYSLPGNYSPVGISAGTMLQIGGTAGTSGNLSAMESVNDGGVLSFYRNDNGYNNGGLNFVNFISGAGTVVNSGSGLVVMSASNTYSGPTILTAGTLSVAACAGATAVSATALAVTGSSVFTAWATQIGMANASQVYQGEYVTGTGLGGGTMVTNVSGTVVTLSVPTLTGTYNNGNYPLTFGFPWEGGGVYNNVTNIIGVSSTTGLAVGQKITGLGSFYSGATITIQSIVANTGVNYIPAPYIITIGGATLLSTATNTTLSGVSFSSFGSSLPSASKITFNGGALQWASGNTTDYSGQIAVSAGQNYLLETDSNVVSFATGIVNPTGALTKLANTTNPALNSGTLILNANNTFGQAYVLGGELDVNASLASNPVLIQAATIGGTGTITGGVTVNSGTLQSNRVLTISSLTVNSGANAIGSGTIAVTSGATSVNSGELDVNGVLLSNNGVSVGGGISLATLAGSGTVSGFVSLGGNTTLQSSGTLSLVNGGLMVSGTGNAIGLGTVNAGNTTLNGAATLVVSGSLTGSMSVQNAGALLSGNGSVGSLTVGAGGMVAPGTVASFGTLGVRGNATLLDSGTISLQLGLNAAAEGSSHLAVSGTLDGSGLSGKTFTLTLTALPGETSPGSWNGGIAQTWLSVITTGSGYLNNGDIVIDASALLGTASFNSGFSLVPDSLNSNNLDLEYVPEPSTGALILGTMGMLGLAQRLRRRKR